MSLTPYENGYYEVDVEDGDVIHKFTEEGYYDGIESMRKDRKMKRKDLVGY